MKTDLPEDRLRTLIRRHSSVLVAFSGGVDSSYLAFVAHQVLGSGSLAVTALSPSVSQRQRRMAGAFARDHGLNHRFVDTAEMEDPRYRANPANRCYFCKTELYGRLSRIAEEEGIETVFDGANTDDASDYRPGAQAAREHGVTSPLALAGLDKKGIRRLSKEHGLSTWDEPAMPCLSSRLPYGIAVSREALDRIDRAEEYLRGLGLRNFRVRHHDDLARLEVDRVEMPKLLDVGLLDRIETQLKKFGYRYVTLDLKAFKSGSLNQVLIHRDSAPPGLVTEVPAAGPSDPAGETHS